MPLNLQDVLAILETHAVASATTAISNMSLECLHHSWTRAASNAMASHSLLVEELLVVVLVHVKPALAPRCVRDGRRIEPSAEAIIDPDQARSTLAHLLSKKRTAREG